MAAITHANRRFVTSSHMATGLFALNKRDFVSAEARQKRNSPKMNYTYRLSVRGRLRSAGWSCHSVIDKNKLMDI